MSLKEYCNIDLEERKRQININSVHIFLFNLIFIAMSYGILLNTHFSTDTYENYFNISSNQNLVLGRVVSYFISVLLKLLNVNPARHQAIFTAFSILMMALCSFLILKKTCLFMNKLSIHKLIAIDLAIILSFANIYFLEWYLFPEATGIFIVGLMAVTISIYIICGSSSFRNLLIGFIFLWISLNIYQINIGIYVIFSLTLILLKNDFSLNKISVKQSLWVLLLGILAGIMNIVILKGLQLAGLVAVTARNVNLSIQSLVQHFVFLFKFGYEIWINGSGFMPKGFMLTFAVIGFILLILALKKSKLVVKKIVYIFAVLLINYSIILAPHMLTETIWPAPRTIVGIFAFLSSCFLIIIKLEVKFRIRNIVSICLGLFLLLNFFQIQTISMNHFATNKIDKEYIGIVANRISEYEKENNITVTKIALQKDDNVTYGYYNSVQYIMYDTNIRSLATSWSDVNSINYFTGRNFQKVDMDQKVYDKYFKGKDWQYFDPDEQMIFIGDTLYMMIY